MLSSSRVRNIATLSGIAIALVWGGYFYAVAPHHSSAPPESAQGLLDRADELSWLNRWAEARPLYGRSALLFSQQHQDSKALYAEVSEIPADESLSEAATILHLTEALSKPEAEDAPTRLRILTIRGMLEINYDASQALSTWKEVERLALTRGEVRLATRARGEQGIAAFILGDTVTAKNLVVKAWGLSEVEHDPAATVRYASVFGTGLVQIHRYKEALTPLDTAIALTKKNPNLAYPKIAIYAKIDALAGLHDYGYALQLANESLKRLEGTPYEGQKIQVYISRGSIEREQGQLDAAISDYQNAVAISQRIDNYRGVVDGGGLLALAYEKKQDLPKASATIDEAIEANTKIPDELYLVPRNLAIKGEIAAKMGKTQQADDSYRKAITLVNRMLERTPTTNVQRLLLAEMSDVYSGYFATLCNQKRYNEALQIIDNVRGRVEAQALEHHENQHVHPATPEEQELTRLNLSLINTDDPKTRAAITSAIYTTELAMPPSLIARESITHPIKLTELQRMLGPDSLMVEYVLAEPASYVLAITHDSITHYQLPSKALLEADATLYRKVIRSQKEDKALAHKLFAAILQPIPEYARKSNLIVIPDGALHLLPFSALEDESGYVLASHTVDVNPSATVYALIQKRIATQETASLPFI